MQRPVGIAQQLAREHDEIGLASANDVIGLRGVCNEADGRSGDTRFAPDLFGERGLVAGTHRNGGLFDAAAAGDVDQVNADVFELAGEVNRLLRIPTAFDPIGCGNPSKERNLVTNMFSNRLSGFNQKSNSIFKASTILITAFISNWRHKLVE